MTWIANVGTEGNTMPDARVRHFMTTEVDTIGPNTALAEAVRCMHASRRSCVVVVDGRRPIGVVTERDVSALCARLVSGEHGGDGVAEVMSNGVITLAADASCAEAVRLIQRHRIRRLVIVDDAQELCGIITQTDLLRAHVEEVELQQSRLEKQVEERTRELATLNATLQTLARVDPLLGIGNRRAMDEELQKTEERARRYGRPYALALVDVDHFKKFNDNYGHQAGDQALVDLARVIRRAVRSADTVYRYGGEEFLVLFPEVTAAGGVVAAEHIRSAVEAAALRNEHAPLGHVSVSVGVAGNELSDASATRVITIADDALYRAKELGRNRVELGVWPAPASAKSGHHESDEVVEACVVDPAHHADQI